MSGFGKTAARGAGAVLGPVATAGLVGSGLVKAAQDVSKKVQANPDRELVRGRGQRAKASRAAAGVGAGKGVNLGPTEQQRMLRSQSADLAGGATSKPKAKTSPPKPKAKASPSKPTRSQSSNSDLKSWAAKEQAKLKADQAARKKTSKAPTKRKSGADKSRELWLGH
ncbi:MAG: hypothetical protein VBE63_08445 [Lamprobacter sp.]|uniref:hypothetical protein n=1 Tax=Lamprobacter sp. TaxID=3100796 RepID=UPI002B25CE59|nr:hypothetical protein [Lamprobacter sp.]MEA3639959.1 hypothetical protein [Lamprobacter sp.]